jgi:hypothetical protein
MTNTSTRTHEALRSDEAISPYGKARSTVDGTPLSPSELRDIDAYWRASLYLCLGMLYLKANPLLREPLTLEHIKPRLLGHWGSDAGQAFTYIHFNRLINKYDTQRHLHQWPRARRARCTIPGVPRGDVLRDLSGKERRRCGTATLLQAVLFPRRHRQPCHTRNTRQHPRGRRTGV